MNFAKPRAGEPALLSLDEARTLFHEFGHALHGMLSEVTWPSVVRHLGQPRLRRTAVAALRTLADRARDHREARAALQDRRADAEGADRQDAGGAHLRRRLRDGRVRRIGAGRHGLSSPRRKLRPIRFVSKPKRWGGWACRRRSRCATAPRISAMCFPATAIRPATIPTCGRKCSTPTPSRPSRRPATRSIRSLPRKLKTHIYAAGGSTDPEELYIAFRGKMPTPDAMMAKRGLA